MTDPSALKKEVAFLVNYCRDWGSDQLLTRRDMLSIGICLCYEIQSFINPEIEMKLITLLEKVPEGSVDQEDIETFILNAWMDACESS